MDMNSNAKQTGLVISTIILGIMLVACGFFECAIVFRVVSLGAFKKAVVVISAILLVTLSLKLLINVDNIALNGKKISSVLIISLILVGVLIILLVTQYLWK